MELIYTLKRMTFGAAPDEALFRLPNPDAREVKELSNWDAAKIRKQLAGRPAPEVALMDLNKNLISLSALKGKVVLLDFWTTWCAPCRADAPAIDKLVQEIRRP